MTIDAKTPEEYLEKLPEERKDAFSKLRETVKKHLPEGFEECINYKMLGYVVPHALYPDGYHCDPKLPLPFINIASQKNFVALYHMGIYANPEMLDWFVKEYPKHVSTKLDMGKSCIRFKKMDQIPFDLIGQLCEKMTPQDWIKIYENQIKKS
ncbi:DUF1801 domain-containing protein [Flagellimonas zhangzhouensis]|uniref:YdhG-like domain-containing protein n=1 Tax=Flagellimonas zhangzhouensis TaxID=1073328 RepID=A0A1H2U3Y9_9FLAO|nr:DUF1801 domain-containing protein [Allomuricauda zhangzhouensis]SDQ21104.1 protein of unknown function (DU1801) [Allomuricauda zhangzhouensis]SDW50154.1 protein of unknown function (DU1801) [Allomuricauda zhangzhouensis]